MDISAIILIAVALFVVYAIVQYNKLVRLNIRVDEAFAQIEVQLKRRADLIPNLVQTVKGYAKHEKETYTAVTEARSRVGSIQMTKELLDNPEQMAKFQKAQGELSGALQRLMVVAEKYPDLN